MTKYKFPQKTVNEIIQRYKKYTYKNKHEFLSPLCKDEDNNIFLGDIAKEGISYKVEGYIPHKCNKGEWVGEIHSHPEVRLYENFFEFLKGQSEDDINHTISGKIEKSYKYPALFCTIQPMKDTESTLELEVQCDKYEDFDVEILADIKRDAEPLTDDLLGEYDKYPKNKKIGKDVIEAWKKGDGSGKTGYPFKDAHGFYIDINKAQAELYETGDIKDDSKALYRAILFYQADMASIKKGLQKKGLLKSGVFPITCKKQKIGRKNMEILQCFAKDEELEL